MAERCILVVPFEGGHCTLETLRRQKLVRNIEPYIKRDESHRTLIVHDVHSDSDKLAEHIGSALSLPVRGVPGLVSPDAEEVFGKTIKRLESVVGELDPIADTLIFVVQRRSYGTLNYLGHEMVCDQSPAERKACKDEPELYPGEAVLYAEPYELVFI